MTIADQLRKEGLEKGLEKGRKAVAITMLKEGMNIEEIAKLTKLDKKEIELMKKEIKH